MARKRTQRKSLSDQVRLAIDTCGMSRYAIAKATGISQPTLSRFMSGERGLTTTALDTLADFLALNITMGGQPVQRKGR
jgi:transcriptional regulator with XRE-family HTH domain